MFNVWETRKMILCILCGAKAKYKTPVYRDGIIEPIFTCEDCLIMKSVRYRNERDIDLK